jgi:hypothetical protein
VVWQQTCSSSALREGPGLVMRAGGRWATDLLLVCLAREALGREYVSHLAGRDGHATHVDPAAAEFIALTGGERCDGLFDGAPATLLVCGQCMQPTGCARLLRGRVRQRLVLRAYKPERTGRGERVQPCTDVHGAHVHVRT